MIERIVCDGEVLIACILLLLLMLHHATFHVVVVVVIVVVIVGISIWEERVFSSCPSSCGSSSSGEHIRAKRVQILFPDIIRLGNSILPSSSSSVSSCSNNSKRSLISSIHVPGDRHESVENDGSGERVEMDSFTCICGRQVGFEDG